MGYQRDNSMSDARFICDTVEDLANLPRCSMGSTCYVIDQATYYMVNSKGEWINQKKTTSSGDSGSGSGSSDISDWGELGK